jgi:hypothetical protein
MSSAIPAALCERVQANAELALQRPAFAWCHVAIGGMLVRELARAVDPTAAEARIAV